MRFCFWSGTKPDGSNKRTEATDQRNGPDQKLVQTHGSEERKMKSRGRRQGGERGRGLSGRRCFVAGRKRRFSLNAVLPRQQAQEQSQRQRKGNAPQSCPVSNSTVRWRCLSRNCACTDYSHFFSALFAFPFVLVVATALLV